MQTVDDANAARAIGRPIVFDCHDRRAAADPGDAAARSIQSSLPDVASGNVFEPVLAGNGVGQHRLDDVACHAGVTTGEHLHAVAVPPGQQHVGGVVRIRGQHVGADS